MLRAFGERQQEILRLLHQNKSGLTIYELAGELRVTRTAVIQHLVALEASEYVERAGLRFTGGRPSRAFRLTSRGIDLFPKQYSWFSGLLLQAVKSDRGSEGLATYLRELARTIAPLLEPRVRDKTGAARATEIVKIMNELSYEAAVDRQSATEQLPGIEAHNCVYHHLAQQFPEVCQFDLELLANLTRSEVVHRECMVRNGNACRFRFVAKD